MSLATTVFTAMLPDPVAFWRGPAVPAAAFLFAETVRAGNCCSSAVFTCRPTNQTASRARRSSSRLTCHARRWKQGMHLYFERRCILSKTDIGIPDNDRLGKRRRSKRCAVDLTRTGINELVRFRDRTLHVHV